MIEQVRLGKIYINEYMFMLMKKYTMYIVGVTRYGKIKQWQFRIVSRAYNVPRHNKLLMCVKGRSRAIGFHYLIIVGSKRR